MTIQQKFFYSVASIILVFVILLAIITGSDSANKIQTNINQQILNQKAHIYDLLETTDLIMAERVQNSMRLLKKMGSELGEPSLEGTVNVNGVTANNVLLGDSSQGNNFELVDGLTQIMDGTATIFSKTGQDYVRISTNVIKNDKRAIGTKLSANGKAIKLINQGKPYFGQVDILGNPFLTGYAPMVDNANKTIGIWYVGYSADLQAITNTIQSSRILNNGFIALVDKKNNIRAHSDHLSQQVV
ncbi:MAG: Cache 3/Cache 2 fusion domain-containing protein, partial [Glaciecola sp.]